MSGADGQGLAGSIAVIGLAGRFPGARNVNEFWDNLANGVESITVFDDSELLAAGADPGAISRPNYVKAAGVIDDVDLFDAPFFAYSTREAQTLDPQQRLLLECAWQALEDAGHDPDRFAGRIGVYVGAGTSAYLLHNLWSRHDLLDSLGRFHLILGNDKDFAATRIAYKLNLKGPSLSVQTACSSSLVAVALACQSLVDYQCDMALAGGVALSSRLGYLYEEGGILSPDGHCRPFDAQARGTVPGSGVGVVVLRRMAEAIASGDTVRAVIRGWAVNNDGAGKVGYTAPSVDGQAEVIAEALGLAGVKPDAVTYVEAHGTGTALGDPIEVTALNRIFAAGTDRRRYCAIGSVKSNIGHPDAAAGIAGFIKAVLALQHREIPPTLHFHRPNPQVDFAASPFFIADRLIAWDGGGAPRRAGVSSFGIGGTNVHVVVEEASPGGESVASRQHQLLLLSAQSGPALEAATANLALHLKRARNVSLPDVAYTCHYGRRAFSHRRAVVVSSVADATEALESLDPRRILTGVCRRAERPVCYLLPGQGTQHVNMGLELYRSEASFRREMDACCSTLKPLLDLDLARVIYPEEGAEAEAAQRLNQTALAQPAIFAVEYSLARLLMDWGATPDALIGHSLGEYVAACLAGVFTLEQALTLVAARGRLIQGLPGGAMLSVAINGDDYRTLSAGSLSLAAVNAPDRCTVSGPVDEIEALQRSLLSRGISCRRLNTSHAFHSQMMKPICCEFARIVRGMELKEPSIPYVSNLTGTWIGAGEATDPDYWVHHLLSTVQFARGLQELKRNRSRIYLEVGPGRTLAALVRRQGRGETGLDAVSSMPDTGQDGSGVAFLLDAIAKLWILGADLSHMNLFGEERRKRVPLPTYPFQRQRYWIEPSAPSRRGAGAIGPSDSAVPPGSPEGIRHPSAVDAAPVAGARPALANPYTAPRTETERRVVEVLEQLLGTAPIGLYDDFFELGGHSLLAVRLASRLRELFAAEVTLQALFRAPNASGLAAIIGERATEGTALADSPRPIVVSRDLPIPLSYPQERIWALEQVAPRRPAVTALVPVRLRGPYGLDTLERALSEVVRRHEVMRTRFVATERGPLQAIDPPPPISLPVARLGGHDAAARQAELDELATSMAFSSFDLARGPLFSAKFAATDREEGTLLVATSAACFDGYSIRILLRELAAAYASLSGDGTAPLPDLPFQYADFAHWQRQRFSAGGIAAERLAYWRPLLEGSLPVLRLPSRGHSAGLRVSPSGITHLELPKQTARAVVELCRRERVTLFMLSLAAIDVLLHGYTGEEDIIVGAYHRNRVGTEALIGRFFNTLLLRVEVTGGLRFQDLLRRVRQVVLGANANYDLPYEKLLQELQPSAYDRIQPLHRVSLITQHGEATGHSAGAVSFDAVRVGGRAPRDDLAFTVYEAGDSLRVRLEYDSNLWGPETASRALHDLQTVFGRVTDDPGQPVSALATACHI